jgi:hypothetical protein
MKEDPVKPEDPCNVLNTSYFSAVALSETVLALIIYGFIMFKLIYQAGRSLSFSSYMTIFVFFLCELASLVLYILNWLDKDSAN